MLNVDPEPEQRERGVSALTPSSSSSRQAQHRSLDMRSGSSSASVEHVAEVPGQVEESASDLPPEPDEVPSNVEPPSGPAPATRLIAIRPSQPHTHNIKGAFTNGASAASDAEVLPPKSAMSKGGGAGGGGGGGGPDAEHVTFAEDTVSSSSPRPKPSGSGAGSALHKKGSRRLSRLSSKSRVSVIGSPPGTGGASSGRTSLLGSNANFAFASTYAPMPTVHGDHGFWSLFRRKAVRHCRALTKNRIFQVAMLFALLAALLLPDTWVLADRPDNSDLDILLTLVFVLFVVELLVQLIGLRAAYWGSFFFWMDLLGAGSVLLDLSYVPIPLSGGNGNSDLSGNGVVVRLARVAKLGARAGRFTKLVKLLRFLPGIRDKGVNLGTARLVSSRLTTVLSTRVSILIILMVMIMPLFSTWTYPEQDYSMQAWLDILQEMLRFEDTGQFSEQLALFQSFYDDMGYYPFHLEARTGVVLPNATAALLSSWTSSRGPPRRSSNVIDLETASLHCMFNFKQPLQQSSLMNVILMIFIMLLMVGYSILLSNSVSAIVMRPLEAMLLKVRMMASSIFQSVASLALNIDETEGMNEGELSEHSGDNSKAFGCEAALLEKVLLKLAVVTDKTGLDADTMAGLGEGDRAVLTGFTGGKQLDDTTSVWSGGMNASEGDEETRHTNLLMAQNLMVQAAGLSQDLINSWNINPLELDRARNRAAVTYFLGPHNHGIIFDAAVMSNFLDLAEAGYSKTTPYHNWYHAVDVTHCVYRLLLLCGAAEYLNSAERYALLVSATCHDIGHPGLNNIFLVEASYDLALLYNDKSPLENMHCARLFELVSEKRCNIFADLSTSQYQEVRKTCIEAILHTDNVHHFPMIKQVQLLCEMNSEVLTANRAAFNKDSAAFPSKDVVEVFRQQDVRTTLVQLLLHTADISNPAKPFRICSIWANKVLEEFFFQGDEEKKAGIPVQALNDRDKVNRPFSQVGFIEFLVSPLMFTVLKVLPPLLPLATQMVENTRTWHRKWLDETVPVPGEQERHALGERMKKLENRYEEGKAL